MGYVVEMLNITKRFPGIVANDNITLQLNKGEIHALLGENGAGKSTLMSVLFGLYQPEEGKIKIDGKDVKIHGPKDANRYGIGMVHQHFKLVENFTVLENIVLGAETVKKGFLKMDEARKKVLELSNKYQLSISPDVLISDISVGMQQRVEILKMLYRENEILIFDEPTAVLTPQEIGELIQIMRNLTQEGKSILFITHKLDEIKEAADRVTVLRKGKYIGTVNVEETSKEMMSKMMVGRDVNFNVDKSPKQTGEVVLSVENLCVKSRLSEKNSVSNVSFKVHRGEIVCIAGIEGNGQTDLIYAISGLVKPVSGKVELCGKNVTNAPIRNRSVMGMSHIPEDRHRHGLVLDYTLGENMILQTYFTDRFQRMGFLKFGEIEKYTEGLIEQFDVRCGQGAKTPARSMSGGNQQKAIIAREVDKNPHVLLAVQPTRGLDVGAIEYIHKKLVEQRDNDKAVLLVSLELEEVMNLSDRILVISEGEIVGEFSPKEVTVQELGMYMAGAKKARKEETHEAVV